MHTSGLVSVIIPARNERYLLQTIKDVLLKAKGEIEVIAVLDGYWPFDEEIVDDKRVIYLHHSEPKGMRGAINAGVALARGEFILKTDAHCLFGEGYDTILKADCRDEWVVVPRRYALDPEKWAIEKRRDNKYPVDYMYLDKELHGQVWTEKNTDPELKTKEIDDLMSSQGSCWFMKRSYFYDLELLDEATYGTFWQEFQEIGLKCWLSGGEVKVNKRTWYAHWHKTRGRGYTLPTGEKEKTEQTVKKWLSGTAWHKQIHPYEWLISKFKPIP